MKNIIPSVKGTRDFYPEDFAFRNWLYQQMRSISWRYGYQEFDGPSIEYLELYADKTSEEILREQTFSLKDRDDRDLVLRPEITPTFARMVAQKGSELAKPIRWFSFGRAWRYEQPQKGRGREFWQWEINLLGPETPEADAEILAIAANFLQAVGLTPDEVVIRVSDRSYFEKVMADLGIDQQKLKPMLRIVDRIEKVSPPEFEELLENQGLNNDQIAGLQKYFKEADFSGSEWLTRVFAALEEYPGVRGYVKFDPTIARGFDYYTRTVFEAWDQTGNIRRALFGGGRFDNLTETLGGERIPGVGMAPGDMPIEIVLEALGKKPEVKPVVPKALVTVFSPELMDQSIKISSHLRSNNVDTESWLDPESKLDKQLKYADQKGIEYVVILGPDEVKKKQIVLKNLITGDQQTLTETELVEKLLN